MKNNDTVCSRHLGQCSLGAGKQRAQRTKSGQLEAAKGPITVPGLRR